MGSWEQRRLDHWSCHHPLLLTEGGQPVRKLSFKHLLSTNTFEGVPWCVDDDDDNKDNCLMNFFFLSLNILTNFLRSISLLQSDGEDELKKRQLMELAIINGTYRDSSSKNSSRKSPNPDQWAWNLQLYGKKSWWPQRTFDEGLFWMTTVDQV